MDVFQKIKRKLFPLSSEEFIAELRAKGAQIGTKVYFFDPKNTVVDARAWLICIGDYTKITSGVTILTHDYSLSVLRRVYGEWIGEGAEVRIGENCFIGMNTTILMGTTLGNNVIVGAGSVVHGSFPDNVVIAGNPARVICTLEEHYQNRKSKTKAEAIVCAAKFYEAFGTAPKPSDLSGFKFLFTPRDKKIVEQYGLDFQCNGDEPSEVEEAFYKSEPCWPDYAHFLSEALPESDIKA